MDLCVGSFGSKINSGEICLVDNVTTHTILRDQKYFSHITLVEANVNTISGPACSHGHPLKNQKIRLSSDYPCTACSQGN